MFTLTQPGDGQLGELLDRFKDAPFSYGAVGASRDGPLPRGYRVDRYRVRLGLGRELFDTAKDALQVWAMFDLGWVRIVPRGIAIQPGAVVAAVVSHFGFWSVNISRVIYVDRQDTSYRFAYGTLGEDAESGEERFTVAWSENDDSVCYDVLAFSKPNHPLAKIGYPFSRMFQKRFARDSMAKMRGIRQK